MVLFVHDHIFYKTPSNEYYSNGGLAYSVLERYVKVFNEVKVIGRVIDVKNSQNLSKASGENVSIIGVQNFKKLKKYHRIIEAKKIIKKEIKNSTYLIIRLPSSLGLIALKYAKKYNIPYLIEVVGCPYDALFNYGSILGKVLAPIEFIKMKIALKRAPFVIYITKFFLQNRYPTFGESEICPNVKLKKVTNNILEKRLKKISEFSKKNKIVVGLIGSLDVNYKGHKILMKAASLLKKENIILKIEFLGKGDSKRWEELALKLNIKENIKFLGTKTSGEEVFKWLDYLDMSIQPSSAEAQGRSIIEAMSRGCPIIATKVGGIVELLDLNFLISKNNSNELKEKIKELLRDKNKMEEQAIKNFNESEFYTEDKIEEKRKKFLEKFKKFYDKGVE